MSDTGPARRGLTRRYAELTYSMRWLVIVFWLAVGAATLAYPPTFGTPTDETGNLVPTDSSPALAEIRDLRYFGYPLSSRNAVVQRDPAGLSPFVQAESVLDALALNQGSAVWPVLGALPLPNTLRLTPGQAETGTTVLTYLFMDPRSDFGAQHTAARQYVQDHLNRPEDHVIGVTGSVPARAQQGYLLSLHVPQVEALTPLAIFVLVGLAFRSLVVPLVALGTSGVAILAMTWVLSVLERGLGIGAPSELRPVLVALILGVVTDYAVFYAVGLQSALHREAGTVRECVIDSVTSYTPIIVVAGATVAGGTASLSVAQSNFFKPFGPSMAITIVVGLVVAVTLIPAVLGVLGTKTFAPRRRTPPAHVDPWTGRRIREKPSATAIFVEVMTHRAVALLAAVACIAVLVFASLPLFSARLGAGFTSSLPESNAVSRASEQASLGFAPGITSPTTLLIEGGGITERVDAITTLQHAIEGEPGISGVVGPGQTLPRQDLGLMLANSGDAARMLVIFDHSPLDATAIRDLTALRERLPELARRAGLGGYTYSVAGDTALAESLVNDTLDDLTRIAVVGLLVNLALLAWFLRALAAPLYLLGCSVLALAASLGLTTWVFTDLLGRDGLTFYVPFAAAVLLVSLGSDYNIFGVGRVWKEADDRSLPDAMRIALPDTARAITTAGLALAVSFGMLAVIPLAAFWELAFAMTVGILIDAFLVRSIMVPAMLTLFGSFSTWPRKRTALPARPRRW